MRTPGKRHAGRRASSAVRARMMTVFVASTSLAVHAATPLRFGHTRADAIAGSILRSSTGRRRIQRPTTVARRHGQRALVYLVARHARMLPTTRSVDDMDDLDDKADDYVN